MWIRLRGVWIRSGSRRPCRREPRESSQSIFMAILATSIALIKSPPGLDYGSSQDAAEAHFARYRGRPIGGLADVTTFSFYGNKIVTCGEGGALTTNDIKLDRQFRLLRNQGMDPDRRYFFPVVGYNYRLTNVACALLCAQLERREQLIQRRQEIYSRYRRHLQGIPGLELQPVASWAQVTPWLFCATVDAARFGRSRDEVIALLDRNRIETRPFFIPIHQLPPYAVYAGRTEYPVTERLC